MKKDNKILLYSMINNLVIAIIKISSGFVFKLSSLFADGLHTLSDFITDVVSMISSKISSKRPTKEHPFGFGRVSYLSNLLIGIVLIILGIFVAINSFLVKSHIPSLKLLIILIMVFVLKLVAILVMEKVGKKTNSLVLLTSSEESKTDLYSSIGVLIITVLLQFSKYIPFLKYSDIVGTIIISLIILKMGVKIIKANAIAIIGEVENNKLLEEKVNELLKEIKGIKNKKYEFIKYGSYYRLNLTIELEENITLKQILKLKNRIKTTIVRHYSLKIKYVNINITNDL